MGGDLQSATAREVLPWVLPGRSMAGSTPDATCSRLSHSPAEDDNSRTGQHPQQQPIGDHNNPESAFAGQLSHQTSVPGLGSQFHIRYEDLEWYGDEKSNLQRLGQGGFGKVFRAKWRGQGDVAIKVFNAPTCEYDLEQCHEEIVRLFSLRHKHIVTCHGAVIGPSQDLMLITEYMNAGDVGHALGKEIAPGWTNQTYKIALHTAKALHSLHSRTPPVWHLDVKSFNILLKKKGIHFKAKLCDLGLARLAPSTWRPLTCRQGHGTPFWMAPEIINDGKASMTSDTWSYGVVLWELITGEQPAGRRLRPFKEGECPPGVQELADRCK